MSTESTWVLNYAQPTHDRTGFTFTVGNHPVVLTACGLGANEAIGVEVLVGCGDDICWSPAVINGCPITVSPMQNPSAILLPGTYRLAASDDGAEFASPADVKVWAQAAQDGMIAPITYTVSQPTDLDALKNVTPVVVDPPVCDVITDTFGPGTYTEANLPLAGSIYEIQFNAQDETATGELAGTKGAGSIPFTGCHGEINKWSAPTINGQLCYISGFTLTVTAGEVEVTAICVA